MATEARAGAAPALGNVKMIIGGEQVDAADGQTFDVINPATGELLARAPLGGREDVDRAVAAAQKLSNLVKQNPEELPQLESRTVGKPISGARGEALGVSLVFEYYAGAAN